MSCYHPLMGIVDYPRTKSGTGECVSDKCTVRIIKQYNPEEKKKLENEFNHVVLIPCGHCLGCRLDHSRIWADRMMLELDHSKTAVFLTLTYDEEHVKRNEKGYMSLCKEDFTLFMKKLRNHLLRDLGHQNGCRFYASGEYGSLRGRPHFHAIIFGISLETFPDLRPDGINELKQQYFRSDWLEKEVWENGRCCITDVSWKTCAYVARYVQKKLSGPASVVYEDKGIIPEYAVMSRRPGIAGFYFEDHPFDKDTFVTKRTFSDHGEPQEVYLPRYLLNKIELIDPVFFGNMIRERSEYANDQLLLELQNTNLSFEEYTQQKEGEHRQRIKNLKRKLDDEEISLNL